jgi:nicotinamide-nucleotide amidase
LKVEVVTIGTELLLGHTVDTNGAELGRALAAVGVEVVRRTSVADDRDAVRSAVDDALGRTGFVVTTGGLGPTDDDLTRETVAALFGRRLVADPAVLRDIEARFRAIGRPMPAANRRQADIPEGATVLPNPRGTAPGLWVEDGGRTVVMLPGVPVELRGLLAGEVLPRLAPRGAGRVVLSRTVRTTGVAESALAERLGALAASLAPLSLAWLPSPEGVDLRLTAWALAPDDAATRLTAAASRVADAVGPDAYGEEAVDLAAVVLDALRRHAWRVAVAESCTGGLLGARLTAVPGASDVFLGGVIAYGDDAKRQRLGVAAALLERHGAVSGEVVGAMVDGVRGAFAAECGIAITGIAGPGGCRIRSSLLSVSGSPSRITLPVSNT